MMREIKFRAWHKKFGWIHVFSLEFFNDKVELSGYITYPLDVILMQYTGLKDKNGKKIYEGDIVYAPANKSYSAIKQGEYRCHYSEYGDGHVGFYSEGEDGFAEGLYPDGKIYEVIGNIYENPELLNK